MFRRGCADGLALITASVPLAMDEVLFLERQKAPGVQHEGLEVITLVGVCP